MINEDALGAAFAAVSVWQGQGASCAPWALTAGGNCSGVLTAAHRAGDKV